MEPNVDNAAMPAVGGVDLAQMSRSLSDAHQDVAQQVLRAPAGQQIVGVGVPLFFAHPSL
jgi:hypothetical protein